VPARIFPISVLYSPQSIYGSYSPLILDTGLYGGRLHVEVWVRNNTATGGDFDIFGSRNGIDWRKKFTIASVGPGEEAHSFFDNSYRYIIVTTALESFDIEIVASR